MRALGPGSVSSLLKIALDVAHVVLWIVAVVVALLLIGTLVVGPFLPDLSEANFSLTDDENRTFEPAKYYPVVVVALASASLYLGGLVAIVGRLRRIFGTLIVGDPFRPENVRRLRFIGFVLCGLLLVSAVGPVVFDAAYNAADPQDPRNRGFAFNPTAWFSVLVVFVLAEVFREGARLRQEAELTI